MCFQEIIYLQRIDVEKLYNIIRDNGIGRFDNVRFIESPYEYGRLTMLSAGKNYLKFNKSPVRGRL